MSNKNENQPSNNSSSLLNPFNLLLVGMLLYFGIQFAEVQDQLRTSQIKQAEQERMIDKLRGFNGN